MKLSITFFIAVLAVGMLNAQSKKPVSYEGHKVSIITTAQHTEYKLSNTGEFKFSPHGQPFENEPCIFVDPAKTFQSFTGIGGALTDASAETYSKLSVEQQEKFIDSYFNAEKGIGYSLIRTNIHS